MLSRLPKLFQSAVLLLAGTSLTLPASAQKSATARESSESRVEVYGGYGYWNPLNSNLNGQSYDTIYNPNATASLTYFFTRHLGLQVEAGYFSDARTAASGVSTTCAVDAYGNTHCIKDQSVYTLQGGFVYRALLGRFTPFTHALGGGVRMNGPVVNPLTTGWGVTGGIGVDYTLPFWRQHLAVRPIQADFQFSQVNYGALLLPAGVSGGLAQVEAVKLSGGLVLRLGESYADKLPVQLGCTAEPVTVLAGEPVVATGSTLNLNPKHTARYTWTTTGGKLTSSGGTATVDTTGLAPGEYVISGRVAQGSKPSQQGNCTTPFTVRAPEPPSITCSASPATAAAGTPIDIASLATSPQNRPLTYSYSTSSGQISGTGSTAKLLTEGVATGVLTVTCNVADDQGKSATATMQVAITGPAVAADAAAAAPGTAAMASTQPLCSLDFARDRQRPARVNNESKACLDDIALALNHDPGSHVVLVGNTSAEEKPQVAAERVLNVRQYLADEKGIESGRIELRVGDTSGRTVHSTLVPAGAILSDNGTQTFDEGSITRHGQAYGTGHAAGNAATHKAGSRHRSTHRGRRPAAAPAAAAPTP